MKYLKFAFLAALVLLSPMAATAEGPYVPSPAVKQELAAVSAYLEGIKTLRSDFLQITSTGDTSKGTIYLERPRNLRIEYDPPTPVLIVADGEYLSYFDKELKQVNHMPVADTPAAMLLRETFSFTGGDLRLSGFEKGAGTIRVSVRQAADPLAGELTLVLNADPLVLLKWVVVDAQGVVTNITLLNPRFDVPIEQNRFVRDFTIYTLQD